MTNLSPFERFDRIHLPRQERSRRAFVAALDAFDALLRERPLARVGMEEVAKQAGIAITAVYGRFDGKNALVLALHERMITTALEQFDRLFEDPSFVSSSFEDAVREIMNQAVAFADAGAHVFRAVLAAADEETNQRAAAFIRAGSERLARSLSPKLPAASESTERDIDFAWRSAVAVLQQQWVLWGAIPGRFAIELDELERRLARAFIAAVRPSSPDFR